MSDNKQYTEKPTCPKCGTEDISNICYGYLTNTIWFECKNCKNKYIYLLTENEVTK